MSKRPGSRPPQRGKENPLARGEGNGKPRNDGQVRTRPREDGVSKYDDRKPGARKSGGGGAGKKGTAKPHFAKPRPKKAPDFPVAPPRLRYLLLHKPYGVLCQFTPEGGKACLKDFVNVNGVYPCGRLDWDSEGLVLLTNDGPLIESLLAPRSKLAKIYWAQVEGIPDEKALAALRQGVLIEGKATLPAGATRFPQGDSLPARSVPIRFRKNAPVSWLRLTLVEGRNRQVRKMTAAVGHPTLRLIRHAIGPFTLEGLEPGRWRELDREEIRTKLSTFKLSTFAPRP
jgi:23S rRNA pseudouridine2457 synthase